MKKYIIIIIGIAIVSCDDFLDIQPKDRLSQSNFYKNADDIETALIGTYAELQPLHDEQLIFFTELTTDNVRVTFSLPTTAQDECNNVAFTSTNTLSLSVWRSCFNIISGSNVILSKLGEIDLSTGELAQFSGEAQFLRAYAYFVLVRLYGDLPLLDGVVFSSPEDIEAFDMSRKSVSQVYALIEGDLMDAANNLSGVESSNKSRASEGAAKTLLGKVFLTQAKYADAVSILEEVINSGYELSSDYSALFSAGNENLAESIFEVLYLSGNVGEGNNLGAFEIPAIENIKLNGLFGGGIMNPTDQLLNVYEAGDNRRDVSVLDSIQLIDDTYDPINSGLKFLDATTGIIGDGGVNYTALRYADVLLMYAEALNETGNATVALDNLNLVRNRAGLGDLAGLDQDGIRSALEQERRVEFYYEGHRWFDLVRTGRAQTVLNAYFISIGNTSSSVADHELLLPLPQLETSLSPELTQNPGY